MVAWAQEDPDCQRTDEEEFLWLWLMNNAGIRLKSFQELVKNDIQDDWQGFCDRAEELKRERVIPFDMYAHELATAILDPPNPQLPPNHAFWQERHIKSAT